MLLPSVALLAKSCTSFTHCQLCHSQLLVLGGGDLADTFISVSTPHRQCKSGTEESAKDIKCNFVNNVPKWVVAHIDNKIIEYGNHQTDDRLAVAVSIPLIFLTLTNSWQNHSRCIMLCPRWMGRFSWCNLLGYNKFCNTGCQAGVAILFEIYIQKAVLCLACRHHVGKLHIKHADADEWWSHVSTIQPQGQLILCLRSNEIMILYYMDFSRCGRMKVIMHGYNKRPIKCWNGQHNKCKM